MIFSTLAFDVCEEYENAELVNAMESITDQIHEAAHLRYNI